MLWEKGSNHTFVSRRWYLKGLGIPTVSHPGETDSEIWGAGLTWEEENSILSLGVVFLDLGLKESTSGYS